MRTGLRHGSGWTGTDEVSAGRARSGRIRSGKTRLALALGLLLALPGGAQNGQAPHGAGSIGQQIGGVLGDSSDSDPVEQEKRLKALNAERQKSLVADTNRLVKLATELNSELNGMHPESLNLAQLRKVAEIEKLAHSVKEKMSLSVKGFPVFQPLQGVPR
jgi:hypothetical protein